KKPEKTINDDEIKVLDNEKHNIDKKQTSTAKNTDTKINSNSKLNEKEQSVTQNLISMENRVTEKKVEVPNNNIEKNESKKGLSTNEKDVKNEKQPEKQYIPKTRVA